MATDDVQLDLVLPGGINTPLGAVAMTFDQVTFAGGAYVRTARGPGGLAEDFVAQFFGPTPTDNGGDVIQGANTQILWPF